MPVFLACGMGQMKFTTGEGKLEISAAWDRGVGRLRGSIGLLGLRDHHHPDLELQLASRSWVAHGRAAMGQV